MGGLKKMILPDGTSNEVIIDWSANLTEIVPSFSALYYSSSFKNLNNLPDKWYKTFTFYDKYSRPIRTVTQGFTGEYIYTDSKYDPMGRICTLTEPYPASGSTLLGTRFTYDILGRQDSKTLPTGERIGLEFAGNTTKVTHTASHTSTWKETTLNILGKEDLIKDLSGSIIYSYDAASRIRSINAVGVTTLFEYDAAGNQTKMADPDAGITISNYNAFGEMVTQTDARGSQYANTYDEIGRIQTSNLSPDNIVTTYKYCGGAENGFGQIKNVIKTVNGSDETRNEYFYDDLGRMQAKFELVEEKYYRHINEYNINSGMLELYTFPSLYKIKYVYNAFGDMSNVIEASTSKKLWAGTAANARKQITNFRLGNGLSEQKQYDQFGCPAFNQIKNIASGLEIQSQFYTFDVKTGNLSSKDELHDGSCLTENYTYDPVLNSRLTSWQVINGTQNYTINYLNNGNINFKSDVTQSGNPMDQETPTNGQYVYANNAGPHAVTCITKPTSEYLASAVHQEIFYTGFNKVSTIMQADRKVIKKLNIDYGPDNQRIKTEYYNFIDARELLLKTKYFFGDYEIEVDHETGKTRELHYLFAGSGLFAIIVRDRSTLVRTPYYIHTDYQGNYNLITSDTGSVVERLNYDPWGQRRNANTWSYTNVPTSFLFDRGYTGHEHLDKFGLINMNGRVFDPTLARFLSPDPILQDPSNTQSHNRYSYCLNDPLKYTDPSGYYFKGIEKPLGDPYDGSSCNAFLRSGVPDFSSDLSNYMAFNNSANNYEITFTEPQDIANVLSIISGTEVQTLEDQGLGGDKDSEQGKDKTSVQGSSNASTAIEWLNGLSGGIGSIQIGMLEYRSSLSINSKIGTFARFSSTYRFLGFSGKLLGGGATYIGAPLSIYLDFVAMQNNQIRSGLFAYRTTGTLSSLIISSAYGGPWGLAGGALVGAGFVAGEMIYNAAKYSWNQTLWQISNFENGLNSGWYPGR